MKTVSRREALGLLGVHAGVAGLAPSVSAVLRLPVDSAPGLSHADAAYRYLNGEMDRFHEVFTVYDDHDSGAANFSPSGFMGDFVTLPQDRARGVVDGDCTLSPKRGTTCLRLTYPSDLPRRGREGWAGIYFLYPDQNWGKHRGHDLSRYCRPGERVLLQFAARGHNGGERAEFKTGGVSDPALPHRDSFGPLSPGQPVVLSRRWQTFTVELTGHSLRNVIGAFCWTASRDTNPGGCTVYLDDVQIVFGPQGTRLRLNEPRFIRSYLPPLPAEPDRYFRNACYVYDQSLALLAYLARGTEDDLRRARLLADALVYAQEHDRHFRDGRLRNAYACGELADPARGGVARLPGWWDASTQQWVEDTYFAGSDCGVLAWALLALIHYWRRADRQRHSPYLQAAERLGEWIHREAHSAGGGYCGGLEGWEASPDNPAGQARVAWKSAEHNLDLIVAFELLADAQARFPGASKVDWKGRAAHARRFCEGMWNPKKGHFWVGTSPDGTLNTCPIPLDVQSWGVLVFREKRYFPALDWALRHCRVPVAGTEGRAFGFDFDTDRDGIWYEGTGQMGVAFGLARQTDHLSACLAALRLAAKETEPQGAVPASSHDELTTGFDKDFGKWLYFRRPHLGATCWAIFAELQWNPYWGEPV